jgi:large subunit ribosomal protein L21
MYAVIECGGKQYRVAAGERIRLEALSAQVGDTVSFEKVLAVGEGDSTRIGTPYVAGASVTATVLGHGRQPKVRIFKLRRRKHSRKRLGHRQRYTEVRIEGITTG